MKLIKIFIFAKDESKINKLMDDLKKAGATIKNEDDVAGFLGVDIKRNENGAITMTQAGLTDRIIAAMSLIDANHKESPARSGTLPKNENGTKCNEDFNYASVVGMLLYLEGHTRPDISFAINQCARYTFNPKRTHEEALKHIGRYLKGTRTQGITFTPTKDLKLDCFVDADIVGLYNFEDVRDPTSIRSHTGHLL